MKRKFFAGLLGLVMIFSLMPMSVFAANPSTLTTDIASKAFKVGAPTEFTFTTTANDDAGKRVMQSLQRPTPQCSLTCFMQIQPGRYLRPGIYL